MFVYGSLLNPRELKSVGVDVSQCKPAVLLDYRIVFDKASRKRCIAANLEKCEGCKAIGIICVVGIAALNTLEKREANYKKEYVKVRELISGREIGAYTFISKERRNTDEIESCIHKNEFHQYLKIIAEGLAFWDKQEKEFATKYINSLKVGGTHTKIKNMLRSLLS